MHCNHLIFDCFYSNCNHFNNNQHKYYSHSQNDKKFYYHIPIKKGGNHKIKILVYVDDGMPLRNPGHMGAWDFTLIRGVLWLRYIVQFRRYGKYQVDIHRMESTTDGNTIKRTKSFIFTLRNNGKTIANCVNLFRRRHVGALV